MKKTLFLFALLISSFSFSQTVFHCQYFEMGVWDSEIEDYELMEGQEADISIQAFETYAIIIDPDKEETKIYWELDEEASTRDVVYFDVQDFTDGEPAVIAFSEEEETILIFFAGYLDGQWQAVMVLSDIIVEE